MTVDKVLIEDWLPVEILGIESRRERAVIATIPPINRLHVWWAWRPLAASSGVVIAGLLPAWSEELVRDFPDIKEFSNVINYQNWVIHLIGIWGDSKGAREAYDQAVASGVRIPNPYTHKMAYKNIPSTEDILLLHKLLIHTWGELPIVLDPTAGGGSIPFVAARLGIPVVANDLNGIAAAVLTAGIKIPSERGKALIPKLEYWGKTLTERVKIEMAPYFPAEPEEKILTYLYTNAIACPRTGRLVPLMPDKWLRKDRTKEAAVRMHLTDADGAELHTPEFEVVFGSAIDIVDANKGTIKRGDGISPYDNLVIEGEYIKNEAKAGRMHQLMFAIAIRNVQGDKTFRSTSSEDISAVIRAEQQLDLEMDSWLDLGYIPSENFPSGNDMRPREYGMNKWSDFFTKRQLLVHGTFAKKFAEIIPEIRGKEGELSDDIIIELGMLQGKAINWNGRLTSWDVSRQKMRSVFDRHDFAFKWTMAEFEGSQELYPWTLHVVGIYKQIVELLDGPVNFELETDGKLKRSVTVTQGSGANMPTVPSNSIAHLCMDPPYFDNVMYAELADYFYVWEKNTLGRVRPDFFPSQLTDKDDEAVANTSRFETAGKRKKLLAELDYQAKMTAIFAESRRVLRDDGVMSVMFTHKKAEAWDSLGTSLMEAGFTIETSWPVNTEAENSLHQANMNSAASTIMLVCRKRANKSDQRKVYLEDISSEVRSGARDAVVRFEKDGIGGVDLLLSTYGPTLSVISRYWPVYSSKPDAEGNDQLLKPEEALDLARQELVGLRQQRLIGHSANLDNFTDFVVIAWDTFKAREFTYDTARLLALAIGGMDIEDLVRNKILEKGSGKVRLMAPKERVRRDSDGSLAGIRINATEFEYMIDAIDTVLYIAEEDGALAAKRFLEKANLIENQSFRDAVQALVNAIPRTFVQGNWVIPEAGWLDTIVTAYLPEVLLPKKDEIEANPGIPTLFDMQDVDNGTAT